jgi:hypothetical protein
VTQPIYLRSTANAPETNSRSVPAQAVSSNTLRAPKTYQIDARYNRSFFRLWERLTPQFFIEANNVFNHPNITSINTTATVNAAGVITKAPTLAPVSTLLEGRIIQLGVKTNW